MQDIGNLVAGMRRGMALGAVLLTSACATGSESLVAGSGESGGAGDSAQEEALLGFAEASPDLLVAGGNALLPGSRASSAAALLGTSNTASPLAPTPLATASLVANGRVSGPLLALNGGRSGLLGLSAGVNALGIGAQVSPSIGAALSPQTASTNLLILLSGSVSAPLGQVLPGAPSGGGGSVSVPVVTTPSNPPATLPPVMVPPVLGSRVPGAVPLNQLLPRLPLGRLGG